MIFAIGHKIDDDVADIFDIFFMDVIPDLYYQEEVYPESFVVIGLLDSDGRAAEGSFELDWAGDLLDLDDKPWDELSSLFGLH